MAVIQYFCMYGFYLHYYYVCVYDMVLFISSRARSETVYDGMVYRHFFGRLEIIPPLLSGRYAVGRSVAAKFTNHSPVHEIWSVYCQENTKIIKIVASRFLS